LPQAKRSTTHKGRFGKKTTRLAKSQPGARKGTTVVHAKSHSFRLVRFDGNARSRNFYIPRFSEARNGQDFPLRALKSARKDGVARGRRPPGPQKGFPRWSVTVARIEGQKFLSPSTGGPQYQGFHTPPDPSVQISSNDVHPQQESGTILPWKPLRPPVGPKSDRLRLALQESSVGPSPLGKILSPPFLVRNLLGDKDRKRTPKNAAGTHMQGRRAAE